ncbi:MAG: SdiA-regulated domain-containing protein [Bacteroidetes bacterium]|nr:SdiA-regulated domain-containing protein [Bacteroidota bacterium]
MMNNSRIGFTLLFILLYCSCTPQANHSPGFKYDLQHPSKEFELPHSLKEISGITFYSDHRLACVQDEKGKIYIYNMKKEEVKESVDFGADHDYEAIALAHDNFYVLHSTGTIFKITNFGNDSQQTKKYDTFLKKENNTEGLCYDSISNSLLIACKGVSHKKGRENVKEIYSFDLLSENLNDKPTYKIHLQDLEQFMQEHHISKPETEELHEQESKKGNSFFEPSEIAVHPFTHEIYVLSSVGKLIVVLNRNGTIEEVAALDPAIAAHPEGMTFSEDGNLFISSEGKGSKKVILEFINSSPSP